MSLAGREFELELLDEFYNHKHAHFVTIFGRRRIGKTELLTHWLKSRKAHGIYWMAVQSSSQKLLASFAETVHNFEVSFDGCVTHHSTWEIVLNHLADAIELQNVELEDEFPKQQNISTNVSPSGGALDPNLDKKKVFILDEFNYLLEADPSLGKVFEKLWYKRFEKLPVMFIIAGSHLDFMQANPDSQPPLPENSTRQIHLQPMRLKDLTEFFPKYSFEERMTAYGILGGMPFYLKQFDKDKTILENIKSKFLSGSSNIQEEPPLILQERLQKPRIYLMILDSIAHGNTMMSTLTYDLEMDRTTINKYLTTLIKIGLVKREVPATEYDQDNSRHGRYVITDAYLRFYLRFIHPHLSLIHIGMLEALLDILHEDLDDFIEKTTFRECCQKWIQTAIITRKIPFRPETIGSHWSATEEIDVVAINWRSHHVLFGECKWGNTKPLNIEVVNKLQQQAANVIPKTPKGDLFEDHYIFFSRAGFTQEALIRIKEINGLAVDLVELERVLNMVGR